ncbi:hypothetical protein [Dyadobacter frigoris]|uniref:hypothetical protein n=1 Tax=Dyadobacter frigoris TaxID=2576211 RepID=UPI002553ECEC|nr:hypothetical protein [Dyadobacter frigoris]
MQLIIKNDKLQKYQDHVQINTTLSAKDKQLYDRFFFAFTQLLDGLSERKVVELPINCPSNLGQNGQIEKVRTYSGGHGLALINRRTDTKIDLKKSKNNVENSL